MVALVAVAAAAVGRLPVAVVIRVDIVEAATALTFAVEVAAQIAGVGRLGRDRRGARRKSNFGIP
jgi:hypothetical protein